jgi:hypothetical protein
VSRAFAPIVLAPSWDGDNIRISAPQLHFLTGSPLERLKRGSPVTFISQLTISTDAHRTFFRRLPERFVISYDIWGERFKVTRLGGSPRSASHLTSEAAEAFCVESMSVSAAGLDLQRPFWLRLELRAVDPKDEAAVVGEPGINITRMIEVFSQRARAEQPSWTVEAGPLKLAELRRVEARGTRGG